MPAAVNSVFELAFWFSDKALDSNEYLQPQKMQHLLFLSQSYFAVAYEGRKLVPALFIAEDIGPVEPSTHIAFTNGRPSLDIVVRMPEDVEHFLDSIWRRFGHHSAEHLMKLCRRCPAYAAAWKKAPRAEIPLAAMRKSFERAANSPGVDQVVKPKMMRSQSGKAVPVKAWAPKAVTRK